MGTTKGIVYLIGEEETPNKFKIGSTRASSADRRIKELQTGNPNKLYVKNTYETYTPFKLEKMLHRLYESKSLEGEWFILDDLTVNTFADTCNHYQGIIDSLSSNPFYTRK